MTRHFSEKYEAFVIMLCYTQHFVFPPLALSFRSLPRAFSPLNRNQILPPKMCHHPKWLYYLYWYTITSSNISIPMLSMLAINFHGHMRRDINIRMLEKLYISVDMYCLLPWHAMCILLATMLYFISFTFPLGTQGCFSRWFSTSDIPVEEKV